MGFWEWMGFENPRDSPKTEQPKEGLPKVTDNVRDSGQTFVFGRSNAGEQVDEKAAMQIPTVYACVRLLAESIAALPLHLYRMTDDNGNKEKARNHPLYKILYRQPNPEMTSFVFWETLMTHPLGQRLRTDRPGWQEYGTGSVSAFTGKCRSRPR